MIIHIKIIMKVKFDKSISTTYINKLLIIKSVHINTKGLSFVLTLLRQVKFV